MTKTRAHFPVEAFSGLARMESSHWWFRSRNEILLWLMRTKVKPRDNFIEVGCGTGFVLEAVSKSFPWLRLDATEYYDSGLSYAKKRTPTCTFREMDATTMKELGHYECIGCFDVLEHIKEDTIVLANFFHALKSRGHLILTIPQHQWLWSAADDFAQHQRRYSRNEISNKLTRAGFRVTYVSSFVSLLLPIMALQRLQISSVNPDKLTITDILAVNPLLNAILLAIMYLEIGLLKLGITFPAGGSLVLVAIKP